MKFNIILLKSDKLYWLNNEAFTKKYLPYIDSNLPTIVCVDSGSYAPIPYGEQLFTGNAFHIVMQTLSSGLYIFRAEGPYSESWKEALMLSDQNNRHVYIVDMDSEYPEEYEKPEARLNERDKDFQVRWHLYKLSRNTRFTLRKFLSLPPAEKSLTFPGYFAVIRESWLRYYATEDGKKECAAMVGLIETFFNNLSLAVSDGQGSKEIVAIKQVLKSKDAELIKLLHIKKYAADLCKIYRKNNFKTDNIEKFCIELGKIFTQADDCNYEKDIEKYLLIGKHAEALANLVPGHQSIKCE